MSDTKTRMLAMVASVLWFLLAGLGCAGGVETTGFTNTGAITTYQHTEPTTDTQEDTDDPEDTGATEPLCEAGTMECSCINSKCFDDLICNQNNLCVPGNQTTGDVWEDTGKDSGDSSDTDDTEDTTVEETTGPQTECGDGLVEGDEECDNGPDNADNAACTSFCTIAVCGDGLLWDEGGDEKCDDGNEDNQDGCTDLCLPPHCGDEYIQEGEECDDGKDGSNFDECTDFCLKPACGDGFVNQPTEDCDDGNSDWQDGCTPACKWEEKIVFVTSVTYKADFGGITKANAFCQGRAASAWLTLEGQTYKAWLSVDGQSPADTLNHWAGLYVDVKGNQVAQGWQHLLADWHSGPIVYTEKGTIPPTSYTWTGTLQENAQPSPNNCKNWTSVGGLDKGLVGKVESDAAAWTQFSLRGCDDSYALYCFEQ